MSWHNISSQTGTSGVVANLELGNARKFFSPPLLFPLPLPSVRSPPLSLEVGPLNPARGLGSAVNSPSGIGAEPQPKSNLVNFSFKIWHLVATISMIFPRINLPNFVQYHRSHLSWYHLGERRPSTKYLRERRSPSTTPLLGSLPLIYPLTWSPSAVWEIRAWVQIHRYCLKIYPRRVIRSL